MLGGLDDQVSVTSDYARAALPSLVAASSPAATEGSVPWAFLDASTLRSIGHTPSRLFGSITAAEWSTYFDGVVVIREEVAPVFDPWK